MGEVVFEHDCGGRQVLAETAVFNEYFICRSLIIRICWCYWHYTTLVHVSLISLYTVIITFVSPLVSLQTKLTRLGGLSYHGISAVLIHWATAFPASEERVAFHLQAQINVCRHYWNIAPVRNSVSDAAIHRTLLLNPFSPVALSGRVVACWLH